MQFAPTVLQTLVNKSAPNKVLTVSNDATFDPCTQLWKIRRQGCHKGSCVNKVNRKKDHTCILDSCHTKFSRRHWANFGFFNYHNKEGVNRRHVTVTQYYRRKGFVAARDQDKSWWDCLFTPEFPLNRDYVVCGDCTQA
ncbi:hypothetical protein H4Q26_008139 [Puccinia striiformis f. sp. tritici PST-130]|nr:hypothetical protein H4Q26_008139 [Puccinia striiformis f. sp. tritici PST-130]